MRKSFGRKYHSYDIVDPQDIRPGSNEHVLLIDLADKCETDLDVDVVRRLWAGFSATAIALEIRSLTRWAVEAIKDRLRRWFDKPALRYLPPSGPDLPSPRPEPREVASLDGIRTEPPFEVRLPEHGTRRFRGMNAASS